MESGLRFMHCFIGDKMEEIIKILREIQKKRTKCQCSRTKVVEKHAFDRVIEKIESLSEWDAEKAIEMLEKSMSALPNYGDSKIMKTAYNYGITVIKKYGI